MADLLDVDPGLYRGIAVVDARCDATGRARAADDGAGVSAAGAGHFADGVRDITVAGDGTGVYDGPGLHVAVLADGTGVYDDGAVRLQVQRGGAGTYTDGSRRYTVRADGSGSYDDGDVRLWVGPQGDGGYDDDDTHVSVDAAGEVRARGDRATSDAAVEVIRERLPRFPPVPAITRITPVGTSCGTVVRLDANVLFDLDRDVVLPSARETLTKVAALLGALEHPPTQVDGYTDSQGTEAHNQDLSLRRSRSVVADLVAAGVPAERLKAVGHGEQQLLRAEQRPDGSVDTAAQAANRRVELVLLDR